MPYIPYYMYGTARVSEELFIPFVKDIFGYDS